DPHTLSASITKARHSRSSAPNALRLLLRPLRRAKLAALGMRSLGVSSFPTSSRGTVLKENPVKRALKAGKPQIGTWLTLGSIAAARFMARAGFPWLTVDLEHTHTDIQTAAYMFGAIADAGCVPLARIPTGRHEYIKSVLDCGAMGIVAPM